MDTTSLPPLARRAVAEFLGTGLLVAIVVGSGIAAQTLSPDNVGLPLLQNSLATAPTSVLPFVAAQLVGVGIAVFLFPGAARAAGDLVVPATSTSLHV